MPAIGKTGSVLVIEVRDDRQFTADRLDTQVLAMGVDERHHLAWRSSSAIAKYAEALRRISLARRSSLTSRSNNLRRSRSVAACAAGPARQRRSVLVVQSTFPAIEVIAAHSDG